MKFENINILLETIDNGIILIDENLNILFWNIWLETRSGIKSNDIINKSILEFFPEIKENVFKRKIKTALALNSTAFYNAENTKPLIKIKQPRVTSKFFEFMQQSITIVPYDQEKRIVCLYVYDNTRLSEQNKRLKQLTEELEEQIVQNKTKDRLMYEQSKMAALGDMIHNIAHQWRQPLSIISTTATGVAFQKKMDILDDSQLIENMENINKSTQYLSKVIDTFRGFVDRNKEYKVVNISKEILEAIDIVKPSLMYHGIELIEENECLSKNYYNEMTCHELPEVLINLINNAKEALTFKDIKKPWIKIDIIDDKKHIFISVEDNAGGVKENIKDKIFEPYFTTKHKSKGTGLGLHICYRIITESLNGKISIENTLNGAKFTIKLEK